MLETNINDSSIHKDGIYDIDKSCRIETAASFIDDNLVFMILAIFVFYKF